MNVANICNLGFIPVPIIPSATPHTPNMSEATHKQQLRANNAVIVPMVIRANPMMASVFLLK